MGQFIDLTNKKFGRLLVLGPKIHKQKSLHWLCRCDCGKEKWIRSNAFKSGVTKSCGCLNRELVRKSILEKRKQYKIVLSEEQKKNLNDTIGRAAHLSKQVLNAKILLLADQSDMGPKHTDKEIADILSINSDSVYYIRAKFSDPNFVVRRNEYSQQRLQKPEARVLRLISLRRYEQKPETKKLQKRYRQNLPSDVRTRKNAHAKIYRQTPEGKNARKRELLRQKEWRRTLEGKLKTRQWIEKYKPRTRKRYNERYQNDSQFRISVSLRKRLAGALKARKLRKSARTAELIGCSIAELALHLERKFKNGMSWENYGQWHINHIIPCSKFDLANLEQQKKCFHYSNVQPLWATENIVKSNKLVSISN